MMQSVISLGQVCQGVECLVKDHNQNQYQNKIMEICTKQGCSQSNILCGLCKNLHNDHREKLVSIAEIEHAFIQFNMAQKENENKLLLLINEFEQFAIKQLEAMVKNMKLLINSFNGLEDIIMKNKQQSYQQLQDQISELVKLIEFDNFKVQFRQINSQEINIQINHLVNQYLLEITNFMKQKGILKQPTQQSITYEVPKVQVPIIKEFFFLEENCGGHITYITPYCVRNKSSIFASKGLDSQKAYLNRNLQQGEAVSLVFRINEGYPLISIGINKIQKATQLSSINTDKRFYLANYKGYVLNNDYEDYNNKTFKDFNMKQGQKYRFTFDPANKEHKQFQLEQIGNSANKITMPMIIEVAYDYRIFVELDCGSEIELINE